MIALFPDTRPSPFCACVRYIFETFIHYVKKIICEVSYCSWVSYTKGYYHIFVNKVKHTNIPTKIEQVQFESQAVQPV